jgi:hypothetical protein
MWSRPAGTKARPYLKNNQSNKGCGCGYLPEKCEALSLNTSTTKKKKKKRKELLFFTSMRNCKIYLISLGCLKYFQNQVLKQKYKLKAGLKVINIIDWAICVSFTLQTLTFGWESSSESSC